MYSPKVTLYINHVSMVGAVSRPGMCNTNLYRGGFATHYSAFQQNIFRISSMTHILFLYYKNNFGILVSERVNWK